METGILYGEGFGYAPRSVIQNTFDGYVWNYYRFVRRVPLIRLQSNVFVIVIKISVLLFTYVMNMFASIDDGCCVALLDDMMEYIV